MPSYSRISGSPPSSHNGIVQSSPSQQTLERTAFDRNFIESNPAATSSKIYENTEEGDDCHSGEDIYSGSSQQNSHSALTLSFRETSDPRNMSRKRSSSACGGNGVPVWVKRVRASPLTPETILKTSIYLTLPEALWAGIFSLLHPADLGRQRRTCKLFKSYLDDEETWRRSRERYLPDHPKPVFGLTEWEMLCVMWGSGCMLCEIGTTTKKGSNRPTGAKATTTAVVYWPFRVRCCKRCLEENTTKEFALLSSTSFPAALLPALPFGIVDLRNNWISNPTHYQPNIGLTKIFWNADVRDILERYQEVTEMGAQEEWLKGLEVEGAAHKLDVMRIEKFEKLNICGENTRRTWASDVSGVVNRSIGSQFEEQQHDLLQQGHEENTRQQGSTQELNHLQVELSLYQDTSTNTTKNATARSQFMGVESKAIPILHDSKGFDCTQHLDSSQDPGSVQAHAPQEVSEVKAKRRSDIEARCLQMIPYLKPELLVHMPAFQAAIKIALPLTEDAWQNLKAKLLKQIPTAEEQGNCKRVDSQKAQQRNEERRALGQKERKEEEWDEFQIPVRTKLGVYADEIIESWAGGITKDTASKFAVDVLSYCRCRFYEENPYSTDDPQHINPLDTATRVGKATLEEPTARRLTLENMKFVFDNKIRPYTDQFGKELFICNGCEYNPRFYAFESVIQHYAAKHTSQMSVGPIVVHWRTDWPAKPPFRLDPLAVGMPSYHTTAAFYPSDINTNRQDQSYPSFQETIAHQLPGIYTPASANSYPTRTTYNFANCSGYNYPLQHQNVHQEITQHEPAKKTHSVYLEQIAKDAREAWFQLSGIKDLPSSVRVHYVVSKTIPSFQARFSCEPPLAAFIEALKEYASLKPVKNANGLLCLECHKNPLPPAPDGTSRAGRLFTLSALLQHFEVVHIVRNRSVIKPDWKTDMVKLPETKLIGMIRQAQGIDKEKYKLLQDVFPLAFSLPLPGKAPNGIINNIARGSGLENYINRSNSSKSIITQEQKGTRPSSADEKHPPIATIKGHVQQGPQALVDCQYTAYPSTGFFDYDSHKSRDSSIGATVPMATRSHDTSHSYRCRSPQKVPEPKLRTNLHQCDNKPTMTAAELFLEDFLRNTEGGLKLNSKNDKDTQPLLSPPRPREQTFKSLPPRSPSPRYPNDKAGHPINPEIHSHGRLQITPDRSSKYNHEAESLQLDYEKHNRYAMPSSIQSRVPYGQDASRSHETVPNIGSYSRYPSIAWHHISRRSCSPDHRSNDNQYPRQPPTYVQEKYNEAFYTRENIMYYGAEYPPPPLPDNYRDLRNYKGDYQDTYRSHIPPVAYPVPPLPPTLLTSGFYDTEYELGYSGRARSRDQLFQPQPPAQYSRYLPPRSPVTEVTFRRRSRSPAMGARHSPENIAIAYAPDPVPLAKGYSSMHDYHRTRGENCGKGYDQSYKIQLQRDRQPRGPLVRAELRQAEWPNGRGSFYSRGRGGGKGRGGSKGGSKDGNKGIKTGKVRY